MSKSTTSQGRSSTASASRVRSRGRLTVAAVTVGAALSGMLSGCGVVGGDTVTVNVGYQSKTINTVNAGTLMRDRGEFEKALSDAGKKTGTKYRVVWQDFSSGAPLTAAMIATHVDIGSMGDYPLLTNGSKTRKYDDAATEFVATTGYNLRGSLNQVVVPNSSKATTLADLKGESVSTSLGSAGDGMFSTALQKAGMSSDDVHVANQDPSIGAAAIEGGQVDALAQFVPWPQLVVFRNQGRLLYDGGDNGVPTFHGVVTRKQFAGAHPEVISAFVTAMSKTNDYLRTQPLQAAQRLSKITGIEPEVAYLYNGPNGLVSFDLPIKQQFRESLQQVKKFLVKRKSVTKDFDIDGFINESAVRHTLGASYTAHRDNLANPTPLTGTDELCRLPVGDPATASEVWFSGDDHTVPAATPSCLLRRVADTTSRTPRAVYVPDAVTGTKLFADHATWLVDPAAPVTARYLPFATQAGAADYQRSHPGTTPVDYRTAVSQSTTTD